jgi:hypothetical protein
VAGVDVFLNRKNYEDQIIKHGQYVVWKSSQACPHVDNSGRPDPNCPLCDGYGRTFYDQTEFKIQREKLLIEGSVGYTRYQKIVSVDKIYDANGLEVVDFHCNQVIFNQLIEKGRPIYIDYTYTNKISKRGVLGTYKGNGIIEVPEFGFQSTRGLFVSNEILIATSLKNLTKPADTDLEYRDAFKNFVVIEEHYTEADIDDQIQMDITYILPHLMLVVGVSEKMRNENAYILPEADASITVPNHISISDGDVFTLIMSEQAYSVAREFNRNTNALDHYDVSRIERVIDKHEKIYEDGVDYIQAGRDKIKWLDSNMTIGIYSIKYLYRATLRALQGLPSLRYGENQPFPRKISLKAYSRVHDEPMKNI